MNLQATNEEEKKRMKRSVCVCVGGGGGCRGGGGVNRGTWNVAGYSPDNIAVQ